MVVRISDTWPMACLMNTDVWLSEVDNCILNLASFPGRSRLQF